MWYNDIVEMWVFAIASAYAHTSNSIAKASENGGFSVYERM